MYARRRGGNKLEVVDEARLVTAEPPLHQVLFYDFFYGEFLCEASKDFIFFFCFLVDSFAEKVGFD